MIYKDIAHVNWSALTQPDAVIEDLNIEGSFLVPQLLAFIASQMPPIKKDDKYSFEATLLNYIATAKAGRISYSNGKLLSFTEAHGILKFLNSAPRGKVLGGAKQSDPKLNRYVTGVPLILSAYREYKDIDYSAWDFSEDDKYINNFLDADMMPLVQYFANPPREFSNEELLAFRAVGTTFRSGSKVGQQKHLNSATIINKVDDPEFDKLPKLLRLMLCQTWVFQPHLRHRFCISNIYNIDTPANDITGGIALFAEPPVVVPEEDLWA